MTQKLHLNIIGMTCINCQQRIEKSLRKTRGVTLAAVSYKTGTAEVAYDDAGTSEDEIKRIIEDLGYQVLSPETALFYYILRASGYLLIIGVLFYILNSSGILNRLAPGRLADPDMSYGMLFLIGVMTSFHCIAMCGGIGLSQSLPKKTRAYERRNRSLTPLKPSILYNLGRLCSYTALGYMLGLLGFLLGGETEVGLSVQLQGAVKLLAGLIMIIMGLNMLELIPFIRRVTPRMSFIMSGVHRKKKKSAGTPFMIGILNGFMPCGPLQSIWLVALASGNPLRGAITMFLFCLGTIPLMLGLGSVVSLLGHKFTNQVVKAGAVLLVVMGLSMFSQGSALSGLFSSGIKGTSIVATEPDTSLPEPVIITEAAIDAEAGSDDIQIINSTLDYGTYPDITVKKGVPVKWTISVPEGLLNGCNYRMIIQDYGIFHTFDYGDNVIEFTPETSGKVRYSCWMGMIQGTITVLDENES